MPPSDPVCAASLWPSIPQAMHGSFRIQASPREVVDFPPEIVSQRWWFDVRNIQMVAARRRRSRNPRKSRRSHV